MKTAAFSFVIAGWCAHAAVAAARDGKAWAVLICSFLAFVNLGLGAFWMGEQRKGWRA